jgi:hypothetical protein
VPDTAMAFTVESELSHPETALPAGRPSWVKRLVSAVLSLPARRSRGSPELPDCLRRDVGLPPRTEPVDHWNYR